MRARVLGGIRPYVGNRRLRVAQLLCNVVELVLPCCQFRLGPGGSGHGVECV